MSSFQDEYGYLFDKDFYSIQEYIQQFNEGITTINPDEIQSEKDFLEQLTYQVKMYGTKIIELYDILDQYTQTDRSQHLNDHNQSQSQQQQQQQQQQQALNKIENLELEKDALLERVKSLQMNNNSDKLHIMTDADNNWQDIISALEEAFKKEQNHEEGFELLQTLNYKINTRDVMQLCEWLGAANREKDCVIEKIWEKLPRVQNESNVLRMIQANSSFFSIADDISKYLHSLQNYILSQNTQYTNKIEYLNQQISEMTTDIHFRDKKTDPNKKLQQTTSTLERGSFSSNYSLKENIHNTSNIIIELQDQLKQEQSEKDKYLQDLQEIYAEYENLKIKYENLQELSKQNSLKEQLEDLKNDLSRLKNENTICKMEECEKLKMQYEEKEKELDQSSIEINNMKKRMNEQSFEIKIIREEEEQKWEKKHNEMVEEYKQQIRVEKQRESVLNDLKQKIEDANSQVQSKQKQIEMLEEEKKQIGDKWIEVQSLYSEAKNQNKQYEVIKVHLETEVRDLQSKIKQQEQEQIQTQSKQSQLDQQIQLLKDSLNQFQKQHKTSNQYEEGIREWEKKCSDLIEENNNLQDTLTRTVEELVQKNQVINSLQDELFDLNDDFKNSQKNQDQMSMQYDDFVNMKEQKYISLETDNSNLKQSLKMSDQELTECKSTIQQMNVQFEKFKQSYIEKIKVFSENIDQIKDQNEKQMQLKEKEISQLKQSLQNQEELIQHYEEALNIKEEKLAQSQSQQSNMYRNLKTQDLQTSLNESTSRYSLNNTEDLLNKLTKYKKQIIKLKERQNELIHELDASNKNISDLLISQKEQESRYIQLQTQHAKIKLQAHQHNSKEMEYTREEFIKLQERYESISKENNSLRNGIFCKDHTFKELEKLMEVNEQLLSEIENYKQKLIQKDEDIIKEKVMTKQSILAAHKKIDELQRKVHEASTYTQRSTHRSSSTHRSQLQEITKEIQQNQRNILNKEDLQSLLQQKNQEIHRLNQIVKSISSSHLVSSDHSMANTRKKI